MREKKEGEGGRGTSMSGKGHASSQLVLGNVGGKRGGRGGKDLFLSRKRRKEGKGGGRKGAETVSVSFIVIDPVEKKGRGRKEEKINYTVQATHGKKKGGKKWGFRRGGGKRNQKL